MLPRIESADERYFFFMPWVKGQGHRQIWDMQGMLCFALSVYHSISSLLNIYVYFDITFANDVASVHYPLQPLFLTFTF